ncbi:MAG: PASTA domain-containing protein [Actinomycetota bacterium]|nr:PASTA domain-containing protein [Actinomycetota bacterium]
MPFKLERLVDNRTGSPADVNGVSERPVEGKSSKGVSHTTETSSVPLPSRSQKRHAAEESFERSVLLLIVILTLLGGVAVVAEIMVSQEAPTPLLKVPNLNGARSLEEAQEMAGENLVVEDVPVESGELVGAVVSQDPKSGETTYEGATISVRVSGRQIEVLPDVEGRTIAEARQSIRSRPFSLEVKTVESSSWEIGRVLVPYPKGGDGVTAEAGTHVTVTVGGGPSIVEMPDLRAPHPEEKPSKLGDGQGTPNDQGSEGGNVEQRPSSGTGGEPQDPVVNAEEPGTDQARVSDTIGQDAREGVAPFDYASWLGESGQYDV